MGRGKKGEERKKKKKGEDRRRGFREDGNGRAPGTKGGKQ